jgi:hypothetical protein
MSTTAGVIRDLRVLVFMGMVAFVVVTPVMTSAEEVRTPDATLVVSSGSTASALGLTLVEGTLRHRGKVYLVTLRGAEPSAASTGKVYGLAQPRDIAGAYRPADGGLRNDRGVTIVFEPPLDLPGGQLQIDIASRVYPKASTGQRGTVE